MVGRALVTLLVAATLVGCGAQNSGVPIPQPDSLVLGRIASVQPAADEPGVSEVRVQAGLPEAMKAVINSDRKPAPTLEKDVQLVVKVNRETVCFATDLAGDLDEFRVGQEVAVLPVAGSTAMLGSKTVVLDAAELYLFAAYRLRYLSRTLDTIPANVLEPKDPRRINSAGAETTPIPLQGGKVLYFAAGLWAPANAGSGPAGVGAERAGMRRPDGAHQPWVIGGHRPYRTAWGANGWETPAPVQLPDLPASASARITWIGQDETACLVEVTEPGKPRRVFASQRKAVSAPWGTLVAVPLVGGESVGDAQRFGKDRQAMVWTVFDPAGSDLWLSSDGKTGQMLEPRINTMGPEWAPRVGPKTILYFCRADRQLLFAGGIVQEVRLPGKQRRILLEAAPTLDGSLLFARMPRNSPGLADWDIVVVSKQGDGWGTPIPVDEWKPAK